jgi:hypothetical protein
MVLRVSLGIMWFGRLATRRFVACGGVALVAVASALLLAELTVGMFVVPVAIGAEGCASEARRAEQLSGFLPDCRAYEMVTQMVAPLGKDSGEPRAVVDGFEEARLDGVYGAHASVDGGRMAWDSEYVLPGSQNPGVDYLSTRGEEGWLSENVIPRQSVSNGLLCPNLIGMVAWSSNLSQGVFADGYGQSPTNGPLFFNEGLACGHNEPRLAAGEEEGFQNLFVRDSGTGSYQLVDVMPHGVSPPTPTKETEQTQYFPASFLAGAADLSHVVFEEELALTPSAPSGDDLYEWAGGKVSLVSILPEGTATIGTLAGATRNTQIELASNSSVPSNIANYRHAVSADGSRVFFEAGGNLYVREHGEQEASRLGPKGECIERGKACTVQVDASQAEGGSGGGGEFMVASETGSEVFFLDSAARKLTEDTPASGTDLYMYDLETHALTDVTPVGEAGVLGVSGAGEEEGATGGGGAFVYFVAEGVLASNATEGRHAIGGQPNLYLDDAGVLTFIATLNRERDSCDWDTDKGCAGEGINEGDTSRVSANGRFIGFPSTNSLMGYDNRDAHTGVAYAEVFLYDAVSGHLRCASCDPTGAPATAPGIIRYPAAPDTFGEQRNMYPQRNVSDSGQVFFESADELLPQDTNSKRNVYEYEHERLYSISSGTSSRDSYFLDASADGSNVFFATAQPLIPRDQDAVYDIYDARVDGGFPETAAPALPCVGEACAGPASGAPVSSVPSSATFFGAGNLIPAKPVHRKHKRRCVAKKRRRCPARARKGRASARAPMVPRRRRGGAK